MIFSGQIRAYTGFLHRWRLKEAIRRAAGSYSYRLVIFLVLSISVRGNLSAFAQSPPVEEYQVKAAYLFNFTSYVEWPDRAFQSKDSSIIIGVLGDNPFGVALESLQGKSIGGRRVTVRHYTNEDVPNCHILFISSSEQKNMPRIVKSLKDGPALTVGDQEGFCQNGGIINLVQVRNPNGKVTVGFEVNNSAARRAGLRISSKLLKIAQKVVE